MVKIIVPSDKQVGNDNGWSTSTGQGLIGISIIAVYRPKEGPVGG